MLPPERRLGEVRPLIEEKGYFVLHAPRQTGKTTCLLTLAETLTKEARFAATLASCKPGATAGDDLSRGIPAIIRSVERSASALGAELRPDPVETVAAVEAESMLKVYLERWCESCPRPVVLFLDEVDSLSGATLLSLLNQLHAGYTTARRSFPWSLALVGVRDIRDYNVPRRGGRTALGTSSPFNIKSESLRLVDFTAADVTELYAQHTADTGQRFTAEAVACAFELTCGQPWLVNALARQATRDVPDRSRTIDVSDIEAAREALIQRRDTHIDSLVDRLRETRIQRIIEPILSGGYVSDEVLDDDVQLVKDLGLVARGPSGLEIANPIYREVIPRALTAVAEEYLPVTRAAYIAADGGLKYDDLLDGFIDFWRRHAEHFLKRQPYAEAAAQLVFMAWLHRIVNGRAPGGTPTIEREYAVGSGRVDLLIRWPLPGGGLQQHAIELKVWRDDSQDDPLAEGLDQLGGYLARLGLDSGTLLIFDRRASAPPLPDRIARESRQHPGRSIEIIRL